MSESISREEFLAHIEPIRDDIKEMVALQREQNGRVAKIETRVGILEDRAPTRAAAAVGAASGTIAGTLLTLVQHLFGK